MMITKKFKKDFKYRNLGGTKITLEFEVSIKGDVDGNGEVTATDLAVIKQQILKEIDDLSTAQYMALDISDDKEVTATDLATMIQATIGETDLSKIE